ncbi:MAG: autotransporter domain-containing protein [Methyloceanibacter sp.]
MNRSRYRGRIVSKCGLKRGKRAGARQLNRPLRQQRWADRKALLTGTALVSTLLIGAVLSPSPAPAQTIVIETHEQRNNSNKITKAGVGLEVEIQNENILEINAEFIALTNIANIVAGNLNQSAASDQSIAVISDIVVNNSGEIDPAIGIVTAIDNQYVALLNDSITYAANIASLVGGDLTQSAATNQANAITNTIALNNSGKVTADQVGTLSLIINQDSALINGAAIALVDVASAIGGDVTQSGTVGQTNAITSSINIVNSGAIDPEIGILALVVNDDLALTNTGAINMVNAVSAVAGDVTQSGELVQTNAITSNITLDNGGGILAEDVGLLLLIDNQDVVLTNTGVVIAANVASATLGDVTQSAAVDQTNAITSNVTLVNSGDIDPDFGILVALGNENNYLGNTGTVAAANIASATGGDFTQSAELGQTNAITGNIAINNGGRVEASDTGILADIDNRDIVMTNTVLSANLNLASATAGDLTQSLEIEQSNTVVSQIDIINSGEIRAKNTAIGAEINNQYIAFGNTALNGDLDIGSATGGDLTQSSEVNQTNTLTSHVGIANSGDIRGNNIGISAEINTQNIYFANAAVTGVTSYASLVGGNLSQIAATNQNNSIESTILINNSGSVRGGNIGIFASIADPLFAEVNYSLIAIDAGGTATETQNTTIDSSITIVNTGSITADSLFAIDTVGSATTIVNMSGGVITGFVDLTDRNDRFDNEAGGTFEARLTSNFRGGNDLLRNANGATIHTAGDPSRRETTTFINLNRFQNKGLISLQDGREGDVFEISNTVGQQDLAFTASGNSTLAVDAFLGGPGSLSDEFIVNGDIKGRTELQVNNTNPGPGVFNNKGIPVVFANNKVKSNAFFLSQPIDTGFFDYDLFFRPTSSGIFELRSFLGAGAFVLPQLITATQDIWHAGSSTWFDRTADLRVFLNGGGAPTAYDPTAKYAEGMPQGPSDFTPAVWVRGAGSWLDRDQTERVSAFGRDYRYNLNRELETIDLQVGLDLGHRGLLSPDDILVFGLLGGFVHADLDYDQLARRFSFEGGQIGGYATYLRGGLFVDTLLNAHLLELETKTLGFPDSIDANTVGLRTDTGYRFGSFNGGAFIEPLATLAVLWADIDGFSLGGNTVSFDDEANVRGRLGLRVGTSYPIWGTTTVEPFVIGSLWGNLSGDNQASLTSSGTTFRFEDDLDDIWGEVSAGVNFFNPSASTAVFAKVDVTFGDEVDGIGGKAGMRVSW